MTLEYLADDALLDPAVSRGGIRKRGSAQPLWTSQALGSGAALKRALGEGAFQTDFSPPSFFGFLSALTLNFFAFCFDPVF